MVSNFPRLFETPREIPSATRQVEVEGWGERVLDRIREAFCGLYGHDSMLQFQQDRLCLKCVSCGHESPGWSLTEKPPTVVAGARTHNRRRALVGPRLIGERRIA
jgi:hypothetical protein